MQEFIIHENTLYLRKDFKKILGESKQPSRIQGTRVYFPRKPHKTGMQTYYLDPISGKLVTEALVKLLFKRDFIELGAFPTYTLPYHTQTIHLFLEGQEGTHLVALEAFVDPKRPKLYPLSIVLWPSAQHIFAPITRQLSTKGRIANIGDLVIPKPYMNFVMEVYEDDQRCDKSKLPFKLKDILKSVHQNPRILDPVFKIRYMTLWVDRAKVNSYGLSKAGVQIKNSIRHQFKHLIPRYSWDIMIHLADNSKHTKSMEKLLDRIIAYRKSNHE